MCYRELAEEEHTTIYEMNEDILHGVSHESPIHLLNQLHKFILYDPHKNYQDHKKDTRKKGKGAEKHK